MATTNSTSSSSNPIPPEEEFKYKNPKDWTFDDTRSWVNYFKKNYESNTQFDFSPHLVSNGRILVTHRKESFKELSPTFGFQLYDNLQSFIEKFTGVSPQKSNEKLLAEDATRKWSNLLADENKDVINGVFMDKIYIRRSYKDLLELIKQKVETLPRVYLTGTPGVGKTRFIEYLFLHCRKNKISVFFESIKDPKQSIYMTFEDNNPVVYEYPSLPIHRVVKIPGASQPFKKDVWYISDSMCPPEVNCVTILVSSPSHQICKEFLKYSPPPDTFYMPLWTLSELIELKEKVFKDFNKEKLFKHFTFVGGIPRVIFENHNPIEYISKGVSSCDVGKSWNAAGSLGGDHNLSSRLIHMEVDSSYKRAYLIFGTHYISQQVLIQNLIKAQVPLSDYFNPSPQDMNKLDGLMYESYAIRFFQQPITVNLESFDTGEKISIGSSGVSKLFHSFEDCRDKDTLYIPRDRKFPCIDLMLTPGCLFQVTKSENHKPIPKDMLEEYIKHLKTIHSGKAPLKIYLITVGPHCDRFNWKRLKFNNLQESAIEFEKRCSISQFYCYLPYPNIEDIHNLKPQIQTSQTQTQTSQPTQMTSCDNYFSIFD